jgi:hypothetical protein
MRIIGTNVHLFDEESSSTVVLEPGTAEDEIPEHLLAQLNNPKVWARTLDDGEPIDTIGDAGQGSYESMTVPQLLKKVKDRGLSPQSTRKADLISALQRDDVRV